jgi:hypothetical protein
MKTRTFTLILLVASAVFSLAGCGPSQPTVAPLPTATFTVLPAATLLPTATPTAVLLPGAVTQTPAPPEPSGGEVEIRIPFYIVAGDEAPPADIPECVNTIPFHMTGDGTRAMIEGEGRIDCHFVNTPQGQPTTYHVVFEFDGVLDGELLPPTADKPSGWLDAYLMLDGGIVQYWSNYPPEAPNPCPESNACPVPLESELIPLPFAYEEGSTITTPWTFILHLR